jgi:CubicO group peptidase (beta-lactamase class C family)
MNMPYHRTAFWGFQIFIFSLTIAYAQDRELRPFDIEKLRERLPLAMDSADIPGLSIAWLEGETVFEETFGYRHVEEQLLVQKQTIFEAASLSKPATAYLVLRMAERGKIHLDVPIIQAVPKQYLEKHFFEGSYPGDIFNLVTPRMLLTHASGMPNWRRRGAAIDFQFEPGSNFRYSGEGFMLLQLALEYVSGKPFDRLARTYVFDPLDMDLSSFVFQKGTHSQLAQGYDKANGLSPIHK